MKCLESFEAATLIALAQTNVAGLFFKTIPQCVSVFRGNVEEGSSNCQARKCWHKAELMPILIRSWIGGVYELARCMQLININRLEAKLTIQTVIPT